ncbi:MAG: hypothetical protein M9928_04750 [Anaerolineae bacterium]|nr:hypothetical protein [Anaerolineae bacterium]MCO5196387.1 hypothetical protein [Anaerolineae bacterium]MCO5204313.1 hypothetical protein [Anaerolineae bacterium]
MTAAKNQYAIDTALSYIKQAQYYLIPALSHQHYNQDSMFQMKSEENDPNPSYRFDELSNEVLFEVLIKRGLDCYVYSEEEHSWKTIGKNPQYYVICDPFCNSFLTSRTFRDAALAICICDLDGQLVACAIGDLQIDKILFADPTGAYILEYHQGVETINPISVSDVASIDDAFIVTPLLKASRRKFVNSYDFFHRAKIIHGVDGAIMIARLAAGHIDAYLDPIKGQPLYEVPCFEMIVKAGGVVTDEFGEPFNLGQIISRLSEQNHTRFKMVAASTENLHQALLREVKAVRNN